MRVRLAGAAALALAGGGWWWLNGKAGAVRPEPPAAPKAPAAPASEGEDVRMRAALLKARSDRLLMDRAVRPENLEEAIGLLEQCREILRPAAASDPAPYVAAREAWRNAVAMREQAAKDLWVEYQRRAHLGDAAGARRALALILRTVPEHGHPDHERARAEMSRWLGGED